MNPKSEVYNEDCMIGMRRYPDKAIDLAICDIPYGLGVAKMAFTKETDTTVKQKNGTRMKIKRVPYLQKGWDDATPKNSPNRFFYVMPRGLIETNECPKYAGLLFFNQYESFDMIKNAPLLHKNKFGAYKSICRTLAFREAELRGKINRIKNGSIEKELSYLKRESEYFRSKMSEYSNEVFMLKIENKKLKAE